MLIKTLEIEGGGRGVVLYAGVIILTGWGLRMPSSLRIIALSAVTWIKGYALIVACGGRIPRLNEMTSVATTHKCDFAVHICCDIVTSDHLYCDELCHNHSLSYADSLTQFRVPYPMEVHSKNHGW